MYTYGGDANLDGKLNIDDYIRIDTGIADATTGYSNGDFNYDGVVNIDDYTILDGNLPTQAAPFPTASATSAGSFAAVTSSGASSGDPISVPEPTTPAAVLLLSVLTAVYRRGGCEHRQSAPPQQPM
jgi:hypothetical protein